MSKLSVSIVVPAFNEASQLADCLDSIACQTHAPLEVIVVDNNSTDGTAAIARRYPFVTIVKESRQGIVYARNAGFNQARGDVIARIDADTNVSPNWVVNVIQLAANLPTTDAVTGPCHFRHSHFPWLLFGLHRLVYFWSSYLLLGHNTLFGSNMFLSRTTWLKVRDEVCLQTDVHEDMDLATHIVADGGRIHFSSRLHATIATRRWFNGWKYPSMWLKTKQIHSLGD